MKEFPLKITAPDGPRYDGGAQSLTVRAITGYVGILAGHTNFTTALGSGEARVIIDGITRRAHCSGGLLSVMNGEVTLLPAAFAWKD